MAHHVKWHNCFVKNIDHFDTRVRKQILAIVHELEQDKFFKPDDDNFVFERDEREGICICQHINDWGDWQLVWYYEYLPRLSSTIDSVVVMLVRQPMQRLTPTGRSSA